MKLFGSTICFSAALAVGLAAQGGTIRTTTEMHNEKTTVERKIVIKDGKDIKTVGCIQRNPGGGYMLTSIASGGMRYALVTDDDLSKYVGHRVEVAGKATDLGKSKVKIESKTTSENRAVGTSGVVEAQSTTETTGELGMAYLGLKSVKIVPGSCL
jgi:hypothetical protein